MAAAGEGWEWEYKNFYISPFFDASGNKNIGATIRISQEILCLLYAEFFLGELKCYLLSTLWEEEKKIVLTVFSAISEEKKRRKKKQARSTFGIIMILGAKCLQC